MKFLNLVIMSREQFNLRQADACRMGFKLGTTLSNTDSKKVLVMSPRVCSVLLNNNGLTMGQGKHE